MMRSTKEILSESDPSPWSGSEATYLATKAQVEERFGKKIADEFRPEFDARTFRGWLARSMVVNKGEHGLRSFVLVEKKDKKGRVIRKFPKKIWLFHRKQVSPIT